MPTCPHCNHVGQRRKRSCCPRCGVYLYTYRMGRGGNKYTIWVEDSPSCTELVDHLRDQIRISRGASAFEFEARIPEMGMAKTLLDKCDGKMELAKMVIDQYFNPGGRSKGIWVQPQSMSQVIWSKPKDGGASGCFNLALAYAKGDYAREREKWLNQEKSYLKSYQDLSQKSGILRVKIST